MATLISSPWSTGRRFSVKVGDISSEQAKLLADDGNSNDMFGHAVSVSHDGSVCVIGSVYSDVSGVRKGAAYVFRRLNGVWAQEAKLTPSDLELEDSFGYVVAISGDGTTVSVSAINNDSLGVYVGVVYVFTKPGADWVQQTKLLPPSGNAGNSYGSSIALNGDGSTIAVGHYLDDTPTTDAGSVFIYTRTGNSWDQQTNITVSDAAMHFGRSVSLSDSGNHVAIGAYGNASDNGCVYVFVRSGSTWTQQSRLTASDGSSGDSLGYSVAISKDASTVIAGAHFNDTKASSAGAAYIFTRSLTVWTQHSKLMLSDGAAGDYFGYSVSISADGGVCAVGAYSDDDQGLNSGTVTMFKRNGADWDQMSKLLASDGAANDRFGYSVALSGNGETCVIGAYLNSNARGTNAGSAYIFI